MLPTPRNGTQVWGQRFRITRARPVAAKGLGGGATTAYLAHPDYWKKVGCKEFGCDQYAKGWITTLSMSPMQDPDELLMSRARYHYIRDNSGRAYDESWDGSSVIFKFPAEQECFREHLVPIERDPVFIRNRQQLDYDQFFDEFNETSYQFEQIKKAG